MGQSQERRLCNLSCLNFLHITNYDSDKQGLQQTDLGGLQHGLYQLRDETIETILREASLYKNRSFLYKVYRGVYEILG